MKPSDLSNALGLAFAMWLAGCSNAPSEPVFGSETNFLMFCSDEDCGEGLTCQCGVCTRACEAAEDCAALGASAGCIAPVVGDQTPTDRCDTTPQCEATCTAHDDCAELGDGYSCTAGFCRVGQQRCGGLSFAAGDSTVNVEVDGVSRSFLIHVPANYDNTAPTPLLLDFHPMAFDANWQRSASGYLELSDSAGFVAVWPQGIDNTWNVGPCCADSNVDDFGFVTKLVRQLSTEVCVDQRRIYASGFSFGGTMAYYLACNHAETFAAVAVSSADLFAETETACAPSNPVGVISFRGTTDSVFPYEGGESNPPGQPNVVHEFQGALGTFETWAALDECVGEPSEADADGCSTHESCAEGTEVTLCTTEGSDQFHGDAARAWQALERHASQ